MVPTAPVRFSSAITANTYSNQFEVTTANNATSISANSTLSLYPDLQVVQAHGDAVISNLWRVGYLELGRTRIPAPAQSTVHSPIRSWSQI